MQNVMKNVFQVYVWLVIYPLAWLWTALICIIIILLSMMGAAQFAGRYVAPLWGRMILFITPAKVKVTGLEHIEAGQSYVVVANHQSTYDILAVYGYMPLDFKWVIKKELRKLPFVGYASYKMGHIFVDRRNRQASIAAMQDAKAKLVDGTSVFFFPEGTRSNGKTLNSFKKGAFKMAKDLELPVLPLSISNADGVMPSKGVRIYPGTITMTFHQAIDVDEVAQKDLSQLAQQAAEKVASAV